jgi:hypothetical protein
MARVQLRRPKISLAGFKDPSKRPRIIIWTGAGVIGLAAFVLIALGVTSTYWFCAEVCHKVQDDTIIAYDNSAHNNVHCMSCHMPVNADPVTFVLHKATALGELYLTVTDNFELPLNHGSHLAQDEHHMGSEQCTQCHSDNREITPSEGIIINHAIHEENDVHCTMCHNRVAHPEDFELTLAGNEKHDDFMKMIACYRCHGLEDDAEAPGECSACHPDDFELKPGNHFEPAFYERGGESGGHAELAQEDFEYCDTCHLSTEFCTACHGVDMPHPDDFSEGHGEKGQTDPAVCANCHGTDAGGTEFCNTCHHDPPDPAVTWIAQHFDVVRETGAAACFECHDPTFCAACHVRGLAN